MHFPLFFLQLLFITILVYGQPPPPPPDCHQERLNCNNNCQNTYPLGGPPLENCLCCCGKRVPQCIQMVADQRPLQEIRNEFGKCQFPNIPPCNPNDGLNLPPPGQNIHIDEDHMFGDIQLNDSVIWLSNDSIVTCDLDFDYNHQLLDTSTIELYEEDAATQDITLDSILLVHRYIMNQLPTGCERFLGGRVISISTDSNRLVTTVHVVQIELMEYLPKMHMNITNTSLYQVFSNSPYKSFDNITQQLLNNNITNGTIGIGKMQCRNSTSGELIDMEYCRSNGSMSSLFGGVYGSNGAVSVGSNGNRRRLGCFCCCNWVTEVVDVFEEVVEDVVEVVEDVVETVVDIVDTLWDLVTGDVNEKIELVALELGDSIKYSVSGSKTKEVAGGELEVEGEFTVDSGVYLYAGLYAVLEAQYDLWSSSPSFDYLKVGVGGEIELAAWVIVEISGSVTFEYEIIRKEKEKVFTIGVVPVWITLYGAVTASISIGTDLGLSISAGMEPIYMEYGVEYDGNSWSTYNEADLNFADNFYLDWGVSFSDDSCLGLTIYPELALQLGVIFYKTLDVYLKVPLTADTGFTWPGTCNLDDPCDEFTPKLRLFSELAVGLYLGYEVGGELEDFGIDPIGDEFELITFDIATWDYCPALDLGTFLWETCAGCSNIDESTCDVSTDSLVIYTSNQNPSTQTECVDCEIYAAVYGCTDTYNRICYWSDWELLDRETCINFQNDQSDSFEYFNNFESILYVSIFQKSFEQPWHIGGIILDGGATTITLFCDNIEVTGRTDGLYLAPTIQSQTLYECSLTDSSAEKGNSYRLYTPHRTQIIFGYEETDYGEILAVPYDYRFGNPRTPITTYGTHYSVSGAYFGIKAANTWNADTRDIFVKVYGCRGGGAQRCYWTKWTNIHDPNCVSLTSGTMRYFSHFNEFTDIKYISVYYNGNGDFSVGQFYVKQGGYSDRTITNFCEEINLSGPTNGVGGTYNNNNCQLYNRDGYKLDSNTRQIGFKVNTNHGIATVLTSTIIAQIGTPYDVCDKHGRIAIYTASSQYDATGSNIYMKVYGINCPKSGGTCVSTWSKWKLIKRDGCSRFQLGATDYLSDFNEYDLVQRIALYNEGADGWRINKITLAADLFGNMAFPTDSLITIEYFCHGITQDSSVGGKSLVSSSDATCNGKKWNQWWLKGTENSLIAFGYDSGEQVATPLSSAIYAEIGTP